jgi:hypothetical protein
VPDHTSPAEESLESFYGDEVDELLEGPPAAGAGESRPRPEAGAGRKRTVTGALMAGLAMGFREVFEPEQHDRTAIEQPAPEQPTEPQKYEIHLDPVAPESSFAIYRPWVDEGAGTDSGTEADTDTDTDTEADPDTGRERAQKRAPAPVASEPVERRQGGGAGALGG